MGHAWNTKLYIVTLEIKHFQPTNNKEGTLTKYSTNGSHDRL
jgi:hypothetical protein